MTPAAPLVPARAAALLRRGSSRQRRAAATAALLVVGAGLGSCATPVDVPAADAASDPLCARILRATPDEIEGLERRTVTAQSATAWGDPAITLRCGVEVPGPSTDRCLGVEQPDGTRTDWLNPAEEETEGSGAWTFVTYGRDPAIEVRVPAGTGLEQPTAVLAELGSAVSLVEPTRSCVGAEDVAAS